MAQCHVILFYRILVNDNYIHGQLGCVCNYLFMPAADIYAILVSFVSTSDSYKSRDSLLR